MADGEFHLVVPHPVGATYGQITAALSDKYAVRPDGIAVGDKATIPTEPESFEKGVPVVVDEIREGQRMVDTGIEPLQAIAVGVDAGDGRQLTVTDRAGWKSAGLQRHRYPDVAPLLGQGMEQDPLGQRDGNAPYSHTVGDHDRDRGDDLAAGGDAEEGFRGGC